MALRTIGTNANNTLKGFVVGFNDTITADLATLNTDLRADAPGFNAMVVPATTGLAAGLGTNRPRINQAYVKKGLLIIPNRGTLKLKDGDVVAWDATTGWPIVISGDAASVGSIWVHS
jgi:hypothetical protein